NHRRELWPTLLIIVASFVLAGLAIVWFDRCFPAGIEYIAFWTGTWKNALMRLTFLIGTLIALYCGHDSKKPQFQRLLALLFVSLLFADFVTHVPRQNPTLPRSAFLPGISSLHVSTRTAKDRAMVSPSAHDLLFGNPYPDMLIDFLRGRMGLLSNLNLLENISKVDGFYALYLREANRVRNLAYKKNPEPPPRLLDFLNVSHITAPGTLFDCEIRTNFLAFVTAG